MLSISTLKAWLLLKHNVTLNCTEFFEFIKEKPDLLEKVIISFNFLRKFGTDFFLNLFQIQSGEKYADAKEVQNATMT